MNKSFRDIRVFLAKTSADITNLEKMLTKVLLRAGFNVFTLQNFDNQDTIVQKTEIAIQNSDCSIHLMGKNYGENIVFAPPMSLPEFQFETARIRNQHETDFKIFVWQPESEIDIEQRQKKFIHRIRNSIHHNMIFSNQESVVAFVEDIRAMISNENLSNIELKPSDIFFMYNELDNDSASETLELLSDIVKVEKLKVEQNTNYEELVVQQIGCSKLAVIYFEQMADWALPFVQQVWKKIGGASSKTPLVLIGNANLNGNRNKIFDAPNVTSLILAPELIPLEIKVLFDKNLENQ